MADLIQFPRGFGQQDIIGWGTTGLVCLDAADKTVIKTPHDDENRRRVQVEQAIYERFDQRGGHSGLLRYHGPYDSGIRLEFAPNWNLSSFLRKHPEIGTEQRLRWARQVTDALCFVHAANVIHGDLTLDNVLLTENLDIKLADFGGSSLDGSDLLVSVHASHRYPGPLLSTHADIFSLGSVYYTIMTGTFPYQDLSDEDIAALFKQGRFPETKTYGPFGAIIMKCWQVEYQSVMDLYKDIEGMNVIYMHELILIVHRIQPGQVDFYNQHNKFFSATVFSPTLYNWDCCDCIGFKPQGSDLGLRQTSRTWPWPLGRSKLNRQSIQTFRKTCRFTAIECSTFMFITVAVTVFSRCDDVFYWCCAVVECGFVFDICAFWHSSMKLIITVNRFTRKTYVVLLRIGMSLLDSESLDGDGNVCFAMELILMKQIV